MKCRIEISDMLMVHNSVDTSRPLCLDISQFYCRLFENARDQSRDYLEEIMRWSNEEIDNYDYLCNSLMHVTAARRKAYGFKQ